MRIRVKKSHFFFFAFQTFSRNLCHWRFCLNWQVYAINLFSYDCIFQKVSRRFFQLFFFNKFKLFSIRIIDFFLSNLQRRERCDKPRSFPRKRRARRKIFFSFQNSKYSTTSLVISPEMSTLRKIGSCRADEYCSNTLYKP
jgi:hypothetical protein